MKRRLDLDMVAGTGVVLLAAAAAVGTLWFPPTTGAVPGPAMFPRLVATAWAGVGVGLVVVGWRRLRVPAEESAPLWRAAGLLALTAGYAAVMSWLGFIATSALFLVLAMRSLGYRNWWRAGALGLSAAFIVYGLFATLMKVPLPVGWLD